MVKSVSFDVFSIYTCLDPQNCTCLLSKDKLSSPWILIPALSIKHIRNTCISKNWLSVHGHSYWCLKYSPQSLQLGYNFCYFFSGSLIISSPGLAFFASFLPSSHRLFQNTHICPGFVWNTGNSIINNNAIFEKQSFFFKQHRTKPISCMITFYYLLKSFTGKYICWASIDVIILWHMY